MPGATSPLGFPYPLASDAVDQLRTIWQQHAEAVDDYLTTLPGVDAAAWTDLPLGSGWTHYSSPTEKSQYARRAGIVFVTLAQTKASFSVGETIGTLPAGFRPSRIVRQEVNGKGLSVLTTGVIKLETAGTTGLWNTFSFPV